MRKAVFLVFIALGAAVGLLATLDDGWGLSLIMAAGVNNLGRNRNRSSCPADWELMIDYVVAWRQATLARLIGNPSALTCLGFLCRRVSRRANVARHRAPTRAQACTPPCSKRVEVP